jgi:hypothetical protein
MSPETRVMNETATASPEVEFIPAGPDGKLKLETEALLLASAVRLLKRHPIALLAAATIVTVAVLMKRSR